MSEANPKRPNVHVSQVGFSDGSEIDLSGDEVILLVGPNNSGKSQALRDIEEIIKSQPAETKEGLCIVSITLEASGDQQALESFFEKNATKDGSYYVYRDQRIKANNCKFISEKVLGGQLGPFYCKRLDAKSRLEAANPRPQRDPDAQAVEPAQLLWEDEELMKDIGNAFEKAFKVNLVFDTKSGTNLIIHVGPQPSWDQESDRLSKKYVDAVRKLPRLHEQGDGMRSFAGILFDAIVSPRDITLLDEPEAFLHPPQMKQLGAILGASETKQIFVATHSSDILKGFLDSTKESTRVIRLQRRAAANVVSSMSQQDLASLWSRPELKYSNALEALFHEQAVICEHDSDCKLYNAVSDYLNDLKNSGDETRFPDTHFVPTGGIGGVPKIASALRSFGVPVKIIVDFDILGKKAELVAIVESIGGDWSDFEADWSIVDTAVTSGIQPPSKSQIQAQVNMLFDSTDVEEIPKRRIEEVLRQRTAWGMIKNVGESGIPTMVGAGAYKALKSGLEAIGLFWVPCGEIEQFCPSVKPNKSKFVSGVLSSIPLGDPRLKTLLAFVETVFG